MEKLTTRPAFEHLLNVCGIFNHIARRVVYFVWVERILFPGTVNRNLAQKLNTQKYLRTFSSGVQKKRQSAILKF